MSTDGNFSQRHLKSGGDCPQFYDPLYFISKEQVDKVGERIDAKRPRRTKFRPGPQAPAQAVDGCQESHAAGDGSTVKTNMDRYDDGGVMALVCRHDIPLFLANIDSPGEQQKYAVALIEHLFTLIPGTATVSILYDVGCVLDRSLQNVSFRLFTTGWN